jgi:hypothetical protein
MPSNKVIAVCIVCIGVITSLLIFQKKETLFSPRTTGALDSSSAQPTTDDTLANSSWIIPTNATGTSSSVVDTSYPDEGTVTDTVSKNFLAQYLEIAKNNNGTITDEQATQIAKNSLSSPDYLSANGPVYTATNIHISPNSNASTVLAYYTAIKETFRKNKEKTTDTEMTILNRAIESKKESDLLPLDSIIASDKAIIADLITMTVPADAVAMHLEFLNSASDMLANTEAIRLTFSDPIKSFAGLSQYNPHLTQMQTAMQHMGLYFKSKNVQ